MADVNISLDLLVVVGFALFLAFVVIESSFNAPYAAEEAQNKCMSLGYDHYKSFSRPPFTQHAYGVICEDLRNTAKT